MEGAHGGPLQPAPAPTTAADEGPATSATSRSAGEEVATSSRAAEAAQQAAAQQQQAAAVAAAQQATPELLATLQYQQYLAQWQQAQAAAWLGGGATVDPSAQQTPGSTQQAGQSYVAVGSSAPVSGLGLWGHLSPGMAPYHFGSLAGMPGASSAGVPPPMGAPSGQQLMHAPVLAPPALPGKMPEGAAMFGTPTAGGMMGLDPAGLGKAGAGVSKRSPKRPRLVWTHELHSRFINAVNHLGVKNAVPKTILQLMNVEGMTRENVASHLQKYRLHLKRLAGVAPNASIPPEMLAQVQAQAQQQHQQAMHHVALNPQGGILPQLMQPPQALTPEQRQAQAQQQQQQAVQQSMQFVGIPQAQQGQAGPSHMMMAPMQQWPGMPLSITSLQGAGGQQGQVVEGHGGQQMPQGLIYGLPGGDQGAYQSAFQQYPVALVGYSQGQQQQQQRSPATMPMLAGYQTIMQPGSWHTQGGASPFGLALPSTEVPSVQTQAPHT
eukprot:jgi/Tetstr1/448986/TSEL_036211.t1